MCTEAGENALVVECKKCGTRFQLDSARIPDDGIRVRCSRCKNAFFLQHPSQSQVNAVEAVVEEAVAHEGLAPPGSTQDLPIAPQLETPATSVASDDKDEFGDYEDDDNWEFNEDPPELDEDEPAEDDPEDEFSEDEVSEVGLAGGENSGEFDASDFEDDFQDVGSIDLDHDRSFTTDPEASASIAASSFESEEAPAGTLSNSMEMGADDLIASNMSIETPPPPVPAAVEIEEASQPELGIAGAREEAFGSVDDFSNLIDSDEPPAATPAASQVEISDNPEEWDFFGDADAKASGAMSAEPPAPTNTLPETATSAEHTQPVEREAPNDWKRIDGHRPASGIVAIASALAWVAILGLLAAGVFLGITGSVDRSVSAPAFVSVGEMRVANIRGQFLETARAGTLYVVTGDLVNPGNAARALHHTVYVNLLGADGRVLDAPPAFAGRDVALKLLREMTVDELQESQLIASQALAMQEIGPGQSATFTAAFVALPEEASHFQIRTVKSEPPTELAVPDSVEVSLSDAGPEPQPESLQAP